MGNVVFPLRQLQLVTAISFYVLSFELRIAIVRLNNKYVSVCR